MNIDHLWVGTHQENIDDMMKKGRCHKGILKSPEVRKKLSIRMIEDNPMYKLENKLKLSTIKRGENNCASKPVIIDGCVYVSLTEAGKALGVDPTTISNRINRNKPGYEFIEK